MISDDRILEIIEELPETSYLRGYTAYGHVQSDAPTIYHLVTGLSHLAAVAPPMLHARLTIPVYPNLYILLVGESGFARKTTAILLGNEVLRHAANERLGSEPASWEALFESMGEKPSQVLEMTEFGRFLAGSSGHAATNYMAKLRTAFVDLYDNAPIDRKRASKITKEGTKIPQRMVVQNPRLSVLTACAPPFLEKYTAAEDWTGGFLGRFIVAWGKRVRKVRDPAPAYDHLLWLQSRLQGIYDDGKARAKYAYAGMAPNARERWFAWCDQLEARFDAELQPWARAAAARVPVVAIKIATLLAMDCGRLGANADEAWYLPDDLLAVAIKITEIHLESTIGVLGILANSPYERDRLTILTAIGQHPRTKREIMQRMQPKMHAKVLMSLLDSMVVGGDILRQDKGMETYYHKFSTTLEAQLLAVGSELLTGPDLLAQVPLGSQKVQ
jgi:hypothetical protein